MTSNNNISNEEIVLEQGPTPFIAMYTVLVSGGSKKLCTIPIRYDLKDDYELLVQSLNDRIPTKEEFEEWYSQF